MPPVINAPSNLDADVVLGFGDEWSRFDQSALTAAEHKQLWDNYFSIFPWHLLPADAKGVDIGCGSGRWAQLVAPRVGALTCVDASPQALDVARRNLASHPNVSFTLASVDAMPFPPAHFDFGYSLGVLHHIPDTQAGLQAATATLRPGAPFLLYLYYAFDNRPAWFRRLWRVSETLRYAISRSPFPLRFVLTQLCAALIYWPLARGARLIERMGGRVDSLPLSTYLNLSFYTMRTDALDRFGTRLEKRYTRAEIEAMMHNASLGDVTFANGPYFWIALGYKR
jgi:SAM-dependent methyltransferase